MQFFSFPFFVLYAIRRISPPYASNRCCNSRVDTMWKNSEESGFSLEMCPIWDRNGNNLHNVIFLVLEWY